MQLEHQEPVVLEVFWEVLLAVTCGASDDEVALQGARKIWSFLKDAPNETKMNFLQLPLGFDFLGPELFKFFFFFFFFLT